MTRLLALETSLAAGSLAVFDDDGLIRQEMLEPDQRTARSLTPAMKRVLLAAGWRPAEVTLVAAAIGPGSFTGLRVGVTAAKTFAYAVGADVIGVSTLEAIAAAVPANDARGVEAPFAIQPIIDAQRKQIFAARYVRDERGELRCASLPRVAAIDDWLADLPKGDFVTGPGLRLVAGRLPPHVAVVDSTLWNPTAAEVGRLALRDHRAGRRDDLWRLAPFYIRDSAAEEKARGKH